MKQPLTDLDKLTNTTIIRMTNRIRRIWPLIEVNTNDRMST
jgi:hypothetical protein